jgi:poly-gamma-glutamate capsule biosynthesis protein CapA/YwtB (metallophosphatase superfamily)
MIQVKTKAVKDIIAQNRGYAKNQISIQLKINKASAIKLTNLDLTVNTHNNPIDLCKN